MSLKAWYWRGWIRKHGCRRVDFSEFCELISSYVVSYGTVLFFEGLRIRYIHFVLLRI